MDDDIKYSIDKAFIARIKESMVRELECFYDFLKTILTVSLLSAGAALGLLKMDNLQLSCLIQTEPLRGYSLLWSILAPLLAVLSSVYCLHGVVLVHRRTRRQWAKRKEEFDQSGTFEAETVEETLRKRHFCAGYAGLFLLLSGVTAFCIYVCA